MGGIPERSAETYRRIGPSKRVHLAMAQRLRAKAEELLALAAECEAVASRIGPPNTFRARVRPDVKPPEP